MKKETKFDQIIRNLKENQQYIIAQGIILIEAEKQIRRLRYRVTLLSMLFFAIILGIMIVITG